MYRTLVLSNKVTKQEEKIENLYEILHIRVKQFAVTVYQKRKKQIKEKKRAELIYSKNIKSIIDFS